MSPIKPAIARNAAWGLALGVLLLAGCSGATTGARNVRRDSARLYANGSCDSGDCSAYMRWRKVGTTTWTKGPTVAHIGKVPTTEWYQSATGLSPATDYEYQQCGKEPSFGAQFVCVGATPSTTSTTPFTTAFWTAQSTPNPQGDFNQLNAVSCTSAAACVAVGDNGLVERWDGATWAIQATPSTGGLLAVSCTSAAACTAVGGNGLVRRTRTVRRGRNNRRRARAPISMLRRAPPAPRASPSERAEREPSRSTGMAPDGPSRRSPHRLAAGPAFLECRARPRVRAPPSERSSCPNSVRSPCAGTARTGPSRPRRRG